MGIEEIKDDDFNFLGYIKQEDDSIISDDGDYFENIKHYLQSKILGFCCCGNPADNIRYVRDGLLFIENKNKEKYEIIIKKAMDLFGNKLSYCFFLYWVDSMGFAEHGGSIYGSWLTDHGKEVLKELNKF